MADFGLKPTGFIRKPLEEIIATLATKYTAIYGDNADTDPDTPDGQNLGIYSGAIDEVWQLGAEIATILDPRNVGGVLQSQMVKLNGLERSPEIKTALVAQVVGVVPETLLAGAVAATSDTGDRFVLTADVVFTGGSDTSVWEAEEAGPVPAEAGTLTVISTPKTGWTSITNAAGPTQPGSLEESDGHLRIRRDKSTELRAVHSRTSIEGNLLNVDAVLDAKVLVNESVSTDPDGLPLKSIRAIVEGGADDEIAQAIFDGNAAGIATSGAASGTAVDRNGTDITINFARPTDVDIWITVSISQGPGFPAGGDELMKQAIVDYAAGLLPSQENNPEDDGYQIADDVLYSRLYIPINSIPSHTVTSLLLDVVDPPLLEASVAIANTEKARFSTARIVIS